MRWIAATRWCGVVLALSMGAVAGAVGGGTITDGASALTIAGGGGVFSGAFSSPYGDAGFWPHDVAKDAMHDQLYKYSWYYRTPQDGQLRLFGALIVPQETYAGNGALLSFPNNGPLAPGIERFDADFKISVQDGVAAGQAQTTCTLIVHNPNAQTVTYEFYNLVDLDLLGGGANPATDDAIQIVDPYAVRFRQTEASTANYADIVAIQPTRRQAATGATLRNILNSATGQLINSDGPVYGDVAVAFEWVVTLAPDESRQIQSAFALNRLAVAPTIYPVGDMNCDGGVDFRDINPFVAALTNPGAYQAANPGCSIVNGDLNADGAVNFKDINAFVAALSAS